jgi:hypothetical protein
MFSTTKIKRIGKSIFGGAGDLEKITHFFMWASNPESVPQPVANEESSYQILELSHDGLFIWQTNLIPMRIEDDFYAIGSGAGYALGALAHGATIQGAIRTAARWDECTGTDIQTLHLLRSK